MTKTSTAKMPKPRCVFLDRDGVINKGGLINTADQLVLLDGASEAIADLKKAGFLVIVTTNQSGLSEDYEGNVLWKNAPLTRTALGEIHERMLQLLGPDSQPYMVKVCGHKKKLGCGCRKPKAGMLIEAARECNIDLANSFMVGDMATDVEAGTAAGVTPMLVLTGHDAEQVKLVPPGTLVFKDLREAARAILQRKK